MPWQLLSNNMVVKGALAQSPDPSKSYQRGDLRKSLFVSPIILLIFAESDTPTFLKDKHSSSEIEPLSLYGGWDCIPKGPVISTLHHPTPSPLVCQKQEKPQ